MFLIIPYGLSRVVTEPQGIWVSTDGLKADIGNRILPYMKQKYLSHAYSILAHKSDRPYGLALGEIHAEAEETVDHRACH